MKSNSTEEDSFTRPLPRVQVRVEPAAKHVAQDDNAPAGEPTGTHSTAPATPKSVRICIELPKLSAEHVPAVEALARSLANLLIDAKPKDFRKRLLTVLKVHPLPDPLGDMHLENFQTELIARRNFLKTIPCWTSKQVTEALRRQNKRSSAHQLRARGKLFAIPAAGKRDVYPAFQFKNGRPRDEIAEVLQQLLPHRTPWEIAQWFIAPNGWLDNDRPIDVLDDDFELILDAAKQEIQKNMG